MFKLTAIGNRDNGTRVETIEITGTLEEIVIEIETYLGRNGVPYSSEDSAHDGFIWFDDRETGFVEDGGQDAIPVYEYAYEEDGEDPDYYLHKEPRPFDVEGVEKYGYATLDVHAVTVVEL